MPGSVAEGDRVEEQSPGTDCKHLLCPVEENRWRDFETPDQSGLTPLIHALVPSRQRREANPQYRK